MNIILFVGGLIFGLAIFWLIFFSAKSDGGLWIGQFYGVQMKDIVQLMLIVGWVLLWYGIFIESHKEDKTVKP